MKGRLRREPSERCSHCGSFCRNRNICNNITNSCTITPGGIKLESQDRQLDNLLSNSEAGRMDGRRDDYKETEMVLCGPKTKGRGRGRPKRPSPLTLQARPHGGTTVRHPPADTSTAAATVGTTAAATATAAMIQGEAGSLDWLTHNWDALPEQEVWSVQKWLMSGDDVPLPSVVQGIHEEFRQWQEEGESIDGWVDLIGDIMVGSDPPVPVPVPVPPPAPPKVVVELQPAQLLLPLATSDFHSTPNTA